MAATVQAVLAASWPRDIQATDIAICSLIHFYVHDDPLNKTGDLLNRLLTYSTRHLFLVDARPLTFTDFLKSLQASLRGTYAEGLSDDDEVKSIVRSVASSLSNLASFSGLHAFFARTERLLLREEMFDEVQNMTILPAERQIDDTSPFGIHLQFCLESYLALEDDGFARLIRRLERWMRIGVLGEDTDTEDGTFDISPEQEVEQALRRGDYSTARSGLEGSFDRAPLATMNRSLPATLLHSARFHLSTHAFEAAKTSLDEALKLARGTNDVQCIAACDELLHQIKFEAGKGKPSTSYRSASERKYKHLREAIEDKYQGTPLLSILQSLEHFQSAKLGSVKSEVSLQILDGHSDPEMIQQELVQASIWNSIGSARIANGLIDIAKDEANVAVGWSNRRARLDIAVQKAESHALSCEYEHALTILTDSDLLSNLDVSMLQVWHGEILRTLYRSALASGATDVMADIVRLRPEVRREVGVPSDGTAKADNGRMKILPSEASYMRSKYSSHEQALRQRLQQAQTLREDANDCVTSLLMASEVMDEAEQADMLAIYREAVYEVAEANCAIGQFDLTCHLLEAIFPQTMKASTPSIAGSVSWLYARAVLARPSDQKEISYEKAVVWLLRAEHYFQKAGLLTDLQDVQYTLARLYHELNKFAERDSAAASYQQVKEIRRQSAESHLHLLRHVQQIAALASARVVAGG